MFFDFGLKDFIDILLVAIILYYCYKVMKRSRSVNLFYGVLIFIIFWIVISKIVGMKLLGSILNQLVSVGAIALIILFQEEIRHFFYDLGAHEKANRLIRFFRNDKGNRINEEYRYDREVIFPIVMACINMSKQRIGALIVIENDIPLTDYVRSGETIDARITQRLIENIFFKNSPLHDGAMIISENKIAAASCILPISHDEVVHGKCSMINKMPGNYEQKFASYRAFLAYMMAHPGKKLLFMGQEFAQMSEWNFRAQLDWNLLNFDAHKIMQKFSEKLNKFYIENPPLWQDDDSWNGFGWISNDDYKQSIISFRRIDDNDEELIAVCNFVPVERKNYRIGVPHKGRYKLVFNTDAVEFGGSGVTEKNFKSVSVPMHGHDNSITMTLAPLSVIYLRYEPSKKREPRQKTEIVATVKNKTAVRNKKTAEETVEKKRSTLKKRSAK